MKITAHTVWRAMANLFGTFVRLFGFDITGRKPGIARLILWCLGLVGLLVPATLSADTPNEPSRDPVLVDALNDLGEKYGRDLGYGTPPRVFESAGANPVQDTVSINPTVSDMPTGDGSDNGEIVAAPIPSLNPTFGWGLGVLAMYVYQPLKGQQDVPPWTTGVAGAYTENKSWGALGFHKMNLDADTWRLLGGAGYVSFNYDFFGIGTEAGDAGVSIPLNQRGWGGVAEAMRRVWPNLYAGLRYTVLDTRTRLDVSDLSLGAQFPPLSAIELNALLSAIGLRVQYDTRDNEFYPTDGTLFDLKANFFVESLGSDFGFRKTALSYNRYLSLTEAQVLAFRGIVEFASDNAPFFALSTYGSHNDLRGYQSGQYRDSYLMAVQGEYRLKLTKRIGIVGFAGVGGVADSLADFEIDNLLPSVGGGFRFQLADTNPINFRVDIARGKDETAIYVGVGEAF